MATIKDLIKTFNPVMQKGATALENNPIARFLLGNALNTARDFGTGLAVKNSGVQESTDQLMEMSKKTAAAAQKETDPQKKAELLNASRQGFQVAGDVGRSVADSGYSQASQQGDDNYFKRGLLTGVEIGTTADMLAHPIGTIKGVTNTVFHPIRTIQSAGDALLSFIDNPLAAVQADWANSFKLDKGSNYFTKTGDRILAGQYKGAGKVVANPAQTAGQLADYGLTTPDEVEAAANLVTGKDGIVSGRINRGLKLADPIDLSPIDSNAFGTGTIDQAFDPVTAADPKTVKRVKLFVNRGLSNTYEDLNTGANPQKVFQFTQDLASQARDYSSSKDLADKQIGQALWNIKGQIESQLYPALDKALQYTPFTASELRQLRSIGNGKLAQVAEQALGGAEARSLQAPFVQGSQMADVNARAGNAGIGLPAIVGGGIAATGNPAGAALALSNTAGARSLAGQTLRGIGGLTGASAAPQLAIDAAGLAARSTGHQNDQTNNESNNSEHGNSIAYPSNTRVMFSDLQPDASGKYTLDTSVGTPTFITEQEFRRETQGMTKGTPEYQRLEDAYTRSQNMAQAQTTPEVRGFMRLAPTVQENANSMIDAISSGKYQMGVLNRLGNFEDAKKYLDPEYQGFASDLSGLNNGFKSLYKATMGTDPTDDLMISTKDSQEQVLQKIRYMTNFFSGTYNLYKGAYAATTSPAGTLSPQGEPVGLPPITPEPEPDWSKMIQAPPPGMNMPQPDFPPIQ